MDAAVGVGLGDRDLHAQVVRHAQHGGRSGQRQDVADDDLGVRHALLLRRCGHGDTGGQQAGGGKPQEFVLHGCLLMVVAISRCENSRNQ
ncbi:hypothetical protein FQZ97_1082300 [compost metagenome]